MPRAWVLASASAETVQDFRNIPRSLEAYSSTLREVALRRQFRARGALGTAGTLISSMRICRGYLAQCEKALTTLSRTGTALTQSYQALRAPACVLQDGGSGEQQVCRAGDGCVCRAGSFLHMCRPGPLDRHRDRNEQTAKQTHTHTQAQTRMHPCTHASVETSKKASKRASKQASKQTSTIIDQSNKR